MNEQHASFPKGNTALIALLVVVVLAAGAYLYMTQIEVTTTTPAPAGDVMEKKLPADDSMEQESMEQSAGAPADAMDGTSTMEEVDGVKVFTMDGTNFAFSTTEMRVKQGDKVKVVLNVKQGFHDWVVDEFSAKTAQVREGNTTEVEFVADKAGAFEYYCSVGSHRQLGMKGNLIVE